MDGHPRAVGRRSTWSDVVALQHGRELARARGFHLQPTGELKLITDNLTKRELFAALMLQGMIACLGPQVAQENKERAAETAVACADALIEKLKG